MANKHWMRGLVLCGAVGLFSLTAQGADKNYACTALKQDAGREQQDMSSPLYWWPDDRLRMVDKGQVGYYYGPDPASGSVTWIDIYAVPNGHGNTLLGSYLSAHFKCVPE